ncbi:peptidoglycan DD-metalloendopeptidase family protein [Vibrio viridaestus]|uniref:Peptidase M23 n=1 Tax=Vibrio viridaestus TaxID=2487322 RepID=A0A3N9THZ5_9VIBR|nr:peptidoglycan DD-metalloendopeptidase family protein [Vibrio viridaestus]RQW63690.1 peptidase M23 [Vibrio viridaestus]
MNFVRPVLIIIAVASFALAGLITLRLEPSEEVVSVERSSEEENNAESTSFVDADEEAPVVVEAPVEKANPIANIDVVVKNGDTLSDIFSNLNLPYIIVQRLLEADLNYLKLDTIKPGDRLELVINHDTNELKKLIFHESIAERSIYSLENDNSYSYQYVEEPGEWKEKLYTGEVHGSFSKSALDAGLNMNQVANITRVFRDKVNFARQIREGDKFNILVKRQFLGDQLTGNSEVEGVSIDLHNHEVAAFLADDGRFYDRKGNSLEHSLDRYPVTQRYRRITSSFNPNRRHPVTGRIAPHNGTDFGTPSGTPVYSTGDGRVIAIRNHPYAGKYIVIEHNSTYKTRYLHLSRFLVKKGQYVKRGEKIALSGATGRITGPHLHFEVLVRNKAVNAMKVSLPNSRPLSSKDRKSFLARVSEFDNVVKKNEMEQSEGPALASNN